MKSSKYVLPLLLMLLLRHDCLSQSRIAYFAWPKLGFYEPIGQTLDANQDGVAEFKFESPNYLCTTDIPVSGCTGYFYVNALENNSLLVAQNEIKILDGGSLIGPDAVTNSTWSSSSYFNLAVHHFSPRFGTSGWTGPLPNAGKGYIGFRFRSEQGNHYGWVQVQMVTNQMQTGIFSGQVVIVDWAFQVEPEMPIVAGALPLVPVEIPRVNSPAHFRIKWNSSVNTRYQVQTKRDLYENYWQNIPLSIVATSTNCIVDLPLDSQNSFFRVVLLEDVFLR